jgi:hypothetical protein
MARALRVDVGLFKQYTEAVFAEVDVYVATVKESDLERMTPDFRGETPLGLLLSRMLVTHVYEHTGEIATLKGLQGAKGYAV